MIIFSDLHLREETAETVFKQVLPGIALAVEGLGEQDIAFLGDWWHIRYQVTVRLQNQVAEVLRAWTKRGWRVAILPGNHDQVDVQGSNALEVFQDIEGVRVFTEPAWTADGLWIPYRKNLSDIGAALQLKRPEGSQAVLFMHCGMRDALMNEGVPDTEGLNPQELSGPWKAILCGHYHIQQTLPGGKIHYIGSPYQITAAEAGQPKGYAVWDGERLTRADIDWGKRYHVLKAVKDVKELNLRGLRPGDDVRVTTVVGADGETISRALEAAGVTHVVTPEVKAPEVRLAVRASASLREYAEAYVATMDHGLDNTKLMRRFDDITQAG